MLDPFRGELTAKYVHEDDLLWAARERLIRQSIPARGPRVRPRREARRFWLGFLSVLAHRSHPSSVASQGLILRRL